MIVVNGWQLFAHPLFLDQLEKLAAAVERARAKDPHGWRQLVFETIPQDPARSEYRQGATLGDARKHWFRAKFGAGRLRLFFRYSTSARIIIFAWVNDETTLRTYGARSDAYAVFRRMLDKGNPPHDWSTLLAAASDDDAQGRMEAASAPESP
jgi:toxin YhaV